MLALHRLSDGRIYDYIGFLRETTEIVRPNRLPVTPIRDVNAAVVMQSAIIGGAEFLCAKDHGSFYRPVEPFLRVAWIKVIGVKKPLKHTILCDKVPIDHVSVCFFGFSSRKPLSLLIVPSTNGFSISIQERIVHMFYFRTCSIAKRFTFITLVGVLGCQAQQVAFSFPSELEKQNVSVFSVASDKNRLLSYQAEQSERVQRCLPMIPYLIGILNSSGSKIDSVVVKLTVFKGTEISRVGVNEMRFGTTSSKLLVVAPRADVTVFLNPTPLPSGCTFKPTVCTDAAENLRIDDSTERMEIKLDSVTFSDKTVSGEDTYGVVLRSEKRLLALEAVLSQMSFIKANGEKLEENMAGLFSSTAKAFEESPRNRLDFYSQELHSFARIVILEIKNGRTAQEVEASFRRHLDFDAKKEILKKRTI